MTFVQFSGSPLKDKAIYLRKRGLSYSEILKKIPVARSTLSLWLRAVGLSKKQKQRLTDKKIGSIRRGWAKWRQQRIELTKRIKVEAKSQVENLSEKDLWLVGVALYWAEGTKEKENSIGQGLCFSNSDPSMVKIFLKWLYEILQIKSNDLKFEIYIHQSSKHRVKMVRNYWSRVIGADTDKLNVYLKKHKINSKNKTTRNNYYGQFRVSVKKSANLNRKIAGWIEGICTYWGVV